jgi:hypothetical protein
MSVPHPGSLLGRVIRLPLRFVPDNKVARVLAGINKGLDRCFQGVLMYGSHFEQFDSTEDPGSAPDFLAIPHCGSL